ncbi:MAG: S4 domain-containing protein YaaA [Bacilli bacterium]|nr:S4 domain-containing protein YaaA [Bacilli bacterium]
MADKIIELREDEPYITLGIVLKLGKIISTGGEAKIFLSENEVLVNGEKENRRGRKLYPEDKVEVADNVFLIKDHGYK